MSFLKEEHDHWNRCNLVLEKGSKKTQLLVSHWMRALVGALESNQPLGRILDMTTPNTFLGAALYGVSKRQHC